MAETVNFLTSNPAIDEFNRANTVADQQVAAAQQRQKAETEIAQGKFNLQQSQAEGPTRLRKLGAEADTAVVNAQYAAPQAAATLEQTRQQTKASIASMNVQQAKLHMDAFTQSIEALDRGDIEGAKRISASVGDKIPDAIIQSSQARAAIKQIAAAAQQYFPGRPKDQMTYITSHLTELGQQQQQGRTVNPQTAPYQPAAGAPTPPETGALQQGETERIAAQLRAQNPSMTYEQSIQAAHGRGTQEFERVAAANARADPNYLQDPEGTLQKYRKLYGLGAMPGAPAGAPATTQQQPAAPAAPQRPSNVPQGSQYSPSRQHWRDPQGNIYNSDGSQAPQVPRSQ